MIIIAYNHPQVNLNTYLGLWVEPVRMGDYPLIWVQYSPIALLCSQGLPLKTTQAVTLRGPTKKFFDPAKLPSAIRGRRGRNTALQQL